MSITSLNLDPALTSSAINKEQKLKKALSGFESMFVEQLLKSMRSAYLKNDDSSGLGKGTMMSIADQALADFIGENDGLGIANILFKHFSAQQNSMDFGQLQGTNAKHLSIKPEETSGLEVEKASVKKMLNELSQPINHKIEDSSRIKYIKEPIMPTRDLINLKQTENLQNVIPADKPVAIKDTIKQAIESASHKHGIPKELISAVMQAESGGNHLAVSHQGAKGLMQLIDSTATEMGVTNQFDPEQNINGGAKYLRRMLDRFGGDLKLALAAYNAGPGNVDKYGGVPPFSETRTYVDKVINIMKSGNAGKDSKLLTENLNKEDGWSFFTEK